MGAIEDSVRLCKFIYRNLSVITQICPTMDTHKAMQIFHEIFFVNDAGEHPVPLATMISTEDIKKGKWKLNPAVAQVVQGGNYAALQQYVLHYVEQLEKAKRYQLTIWPYHAMLGGIGHALVGSIEEALFFHNIARQSQTGFEIKGLNALSENYSILRPEVLTGPHNEGIAQKNGNFIKQLLAFDKLIIAGQAKSHCVAWTIADLLSEINSQDPTLAQKVYLLEDCTSPVVVPGIVDYTDDADKAFAGFAAAGMKIVKSTDPIETWPGMDI
jgi:nicotinamidase-related amidase